MTDSAMEIIHADNYAAFLLALLHKRFLTPEEAFNLYDHGILPRKQNPMDRLTVIHELRKQLMTWKEISAVLGINSNTIAKFYSRHRELVQEVD